MSIRPAYAKDRDFIAASIEARAAESPTFADIPRNTASLRQHASLFINDRGVIVLIAETDAGKPVGLLIAQTSVYIGTDVRFVADVLVSVEPEARGTGTARALMEAFHERAKAEKLHSVVFVETGQTSAKAVDRLCEHFGYTKAGSAYRLQL